MPWWIPLLAFASGLVVGLLSVQRYRRDRIAWAKRRLQLKVLSLELKSLRQKVVSADKRAGHCSPAHGQWCRAARLAGSDRQPGGERSGVFQDTAQARAQAVAWPAA